MASITKRTIRWTTKAGEERTGGRWRARYYDDLGVQHGRDFARKRDAQDWIDEQTSKLVTGTHVAPREARQTLKAYADDWITRQVVRRATERLYRHHLDKHILPALGHRRLEEITRPMVQALVKSWADSAAPATAHARYHTLAIVLRAAVTDRVLVRTPAVKIQLPELPANHTLTPISTETVLALADAIEPRYRALVIVAAGTGMRRGELLGLTRDRVADAFGTILVDRQQSRSSTSTHPVFGPPKTASSHRTIHVAPVVIKAIREHEATYGLHPTGLIFTNTAGLVLTSSTIQSAWATAARAVGTDATPHDLRHYFASVQLAGGISIKELQAQLGHKNAAETLDTYGHLMKDEREHSRALMEAALTPSPKAGKVSRRSVDAKTPPIRRSSRSDSGAEGRAGL